MTAGYYATFELVGKNVRGKTLVMPGGMPIYGKTQRSLNEEINWLKDYLLTDGSGREMSRIKKFKVIEL